MNEKFFGKKHVAVRITANFLALIGIRLINIGYFLQPLKKLQNPTALELSGYKFLFKRRVIFPINFYKFQHTLDHVKK